MTPRGSHTNPVVTLSGALRGTAILALLLLPMSATAQEGGFRERFRDPQDGSFDMSAWLAEAYGFLPMVSIITEPAVDYGFSAALAFFHRPDDWTLDGARDAFQRGERQRPPSISVAMGGYTFNDSWMVGGGHLGIWREDRLRYTGFGGYGSFNLQLAGLSVGEKDLVFKYNMEGWFLMQSLRWRIPDSSWFVGGTWNLAGLTTEFKGLEGGPEILPTTPRESRNGALGGLLAYDSRDNVFTPNRGVNAKMEVKRFDQALLGDYDYWEGTLIGIGFVPLGSRWVLGTKGQAAAVGDNAPFWALPGVLIRGIPAQRYVGQSLVQLEGELRWDWTERWSLVGFGGWGWTESTIRDRTSARSVAAGGGGFRYLIARAFGMRAGVDVAYGEDGFAFYITTGSAFR
jgi:hypothetical protein